MVLARQLATGREVRLARTPDRNRTAAWRIRGERLGGSVGTSPLGIRRAETTFLTQAVRAWEARLEDHGRYPPSLLAPDRIIAGRHPQQKPGLNRPGRKRLRSTASRPATSPDLAKVRSMARSDMRVPAGQLLHHAMDQESLNVAIQTNLT